MQSYDGSFETDLTRMCGERLSRRSFGATVRHTNLRNMLLLNALRISPEASRSPRVGTEHDIEDVIFEEAFSMSGSRLRIPSFVLASVLVLGACGDSVDPGPGHGTLIVRADVSATAVATLVAEVTAPDIPTAIVFNIPIVAGVASGTITIPAGSNRTVTLRAYDAGGILTNSGSATLNIQPGPNATVAITDWNGAPTTGTVSWATQNPGIATVDATGLVTGAGVGSTKIAATFHGATRTATVAVSP